jgi:hypothetical protein
MWYRIERHSSRVIVHYLPILVNLNADKVIESILVGEEASASAPISISKATMMNHAIKGNTRRIIP